VAVGRRLRGTFRGRDVAPAASGEHHEPEQRETSHVTSTPPTITPFPVRG
jgi:hypothetical protein